MNEPPSIHQVIAVVAGQFHIPVSGILSPRRDRRFARPRQIAMWIAREHLHRELTVIGNVFGRDHTTVLHGVRLVERLMRENAIFARRVAVCVQSVDYVEHGEERSVA